jgi:hypothetical protein
MQIPIPMELFCNKFKYIRSQGSVAGVILLWLLVVLIFISCLIFYIIKYSPNSTTVAFLIVISVIFVGLSLWYMVRSTYPKIEFIFSERGITREIKHFRKIDQFSWTDIDRVFTSITADVVDVITYYNKCISIVFRGEKNENQYKSSIEYKKSKEEFLLFVNNFYSMLCIHRPDLANELKRTMEHADMLENEMKKQKII